MILKLSSKSLLENSLSQMYKRYKNISFELSTKEFNEFCQPAISLSKIELHNNLDSKVDIKSILGTLDQVNC